jgi:hypothetical protein
MYRAWNVATPCILGLILINAIAPANAQSHAQVHAGARAQAAAETAAQAAAARARGAAHRETLAEIEQHRLKVVPLSAKDATQWKRLDYGGKYYRAGDYLARFTPIGYFVQVKHGSRTLTTKRFYSLNEAVDRAVQMAKDTRYPRIPGYTPPDRRRNNGSFAPDAGLPPAETEDEDDSDFRFDFENDEVAVWRCIEKGRENISISFNKETEKFAVNVAEVKAVDDLETLDDAIRMATSIGRKDSKSSTRKPRSLKPEETKSRLDDPMPPPKTPPANKPNINDKDKET